MARTEESEKKVNKHFDRREKERREVTTDLELSAPELGCSSRILIFFSLFCN